MAAVLVACSDADDGVSPTATSTAPACPSPIEFSPYVGRLATSRGHSAATRSFSAIDTRRLKSPDCGFGVFAYNTATTPYADFRTPLMASETALPSQPSTAASVLMHNERVAYDSIASAWLTTGARRFWPVLPIDSTRSPFVSFFAYAPYTPEADAVPTPALPRYSDPYIAFTLSNDPARQTDLLWATTLEYYPDATSSLDAASLDASSSLAVSPLGVSALTFPDPAADPATRPTYNVPADLTLQATNGLVLLHFKHALAKIDALQAVLDVSEDAPLSNTKVTLNAVTLHCDSLPNSAIFNLVTGLWSDRDTLYPAAVTCSPTLLATVAEPATFTTPIHTRQRFDELPVGVTTTPAPITTTDHPLYFIPGTCPVVDITVDYTVRSFDPKLADKYTEVRQRVTKRLHVLEQLLLNHRYDILLHIALADVSFTATVSDWDVVPYPSAHPQPDDPLPITTTTVEHVYLPANVDVTP